MDNAGAEMRLWTCGGLHCSVRVVPRSGVKELGRVSVLQLQKVGSSSVIVVDGDIFDVRPAWSDEHMETLSAADPGRYRPHFVKKGYYLPDGIHFLPDFKPRFLKSLSASTEKLP